MSDKNLFYNRELSWLEFDKRVKRRIRIFRYLNGSSS